MEFYIIYANDSGTIQQNIAVVDTLEAAKQKIKDEFLGTNPDIIEYCVERWKIGETNLDKKCEFCLDNEICHYE